MIKKREMKEIMKDLTEIIDEIEMCPMERSLIKTNIIESRKEGENQRKVDFLPDAIQNYINENIAFRTIQIDGRDLTFQFAAEVVTQYTEHLSIIIDNIYSMIPEVCNRNTIVPLRVAPTRDQIGWEGSVIYIGRVVDTLDNFVKPDPSIVLEYVGLYENQFVIIVYNRCRQQVGYTLMDIN